jgi:4-amino-4-deoxy-L-arabinose transferase-like glycosyltransferase
VVALAIVIAAFVVAIHAMAIGGGFVWDDVAAISENRLIHSPVGLPEFWLSTEQPDYWPVSYSALWLEWRLFGQNPAGYRVVNLGLHTINALLVWLLLSRLGVRGAWLCGLIFAIHPVTVEAIEWIIQIKTLLSTTFALLTLVLFLKFDETNRVIWLVAALTAFLLALLAKSAVVALPAVLLLLLYLRKGRLVRRDLLSVLPFVALSIVMGAVGAWYQRNNAIGSEIVRSDGMLSRMAIGTQAIWFYVAKAFLPFKLSFIYSRWQLPAGIGGGGGQFLPSH